MKTWLDEKPSFDDWDFKESRRIEYLLISNQIDVEVKNDILSLLQQLEQTIERREIEIEDNYDYEIETMIKDFKKKCSCGAARAFTYNR